MRSHLLLYEVPMTIHGEVHEPDGTVVDKGISILAVQVWLAAYCENNACKPTFAHTSSSSDVAQRSCWCNTLDKQSWGLPE